MGRLAGKVAVVTGGTSGIGKRTVERMIEEGAAVVMGARRVEEGTALAAALGPKMVFRRTDVVQESEVKALIDLAVERFGRLDIVFNNAAGRSPTGGIDTVAMDLAKASFDSLFFPIVAAFKHAGPIMMAQGSGSIISNGSVAGTRAGYSSSVIYSAAKAAVIHLTRCAAMQFGEKGVRVNTVSPGGIATGIFGKSLGLDTAQAETTGPIAARELAKWQAIPRAGETDDIANAVIYLASDESTFVNGHDLIVDGGLVAGRMWTPQWEAMKNLRAAFDG